MTKHILAYKINQEKVYCTILYNILYNTNYFSVLSKVKVILKLTEKNNYKNLYLVNFNRRYLNKNC